MISNKQFNIKVVRTCSYSFDDINKICSKEYTIYEKTVEPGKYRGIGVAFSTA